MFDLDERSSGVLLHLTSLPGPCGNGDLGGEARRFAGELARCGQRWWQMLPVGPTGEGNSPYSARSAFAGSPLFIDLEALARDGLLRERTLPPRFPSGRVDYAAARAYRDGELRRAFGAFEKRRASASYRSFRERTAGWLEDFALFSALRTAAGVPWSGWDRDLRLRRPAALSRARRELAREIELRRFEQWVFDEQWRSFKQHCKSKGVGLMGDVPFFVAYDSADVWAHQDLFELDREGNPTVVAGVPPDFFSKTGQRWGNPHYRWSRLRRSGYAWWMERFEHELSRFDALRLDHFIGFWRTWQVPASAATAEKGRWAAGPRDELFLRLLRKRRGRRLPFVAEDLGLVTPEVKALRDRFELPGMKLLQFAFGTDLQAHDFRPHNYPRRSAAYTGTHDNDTAVGWFFDPGGRERTPEQAETERAMALAYLGLTEPREIHWHMIRCVLTSVASLAIVPMQDLLGLGSEARMNRPGTADGNWEWRMREGAFDRRIGDRLAELSQLTDRFAHPARAGRRQAPQRQAAREARA
jgi:4-alpha-glucanotransferase